MAMTDAQLDDWRSKRTGRKVQTNAPDKAPSDGRQPDGDGGNRSPIFDMGADPASLSTLLNGSQEDNTPAPRNDDGEVSRLQSQLDAAHGRVGPLQRQLEELRAANEAAQRQLIEMQSKLAEKEALEASLRAQKMAESFDPFEGMTKDEIDMLDPTAAEMIRRAAKNAYSKAASNVKDPEALIHKALAERDARARDNYIRATAESLGLVKLGSDPQFNKFLTEDDSAGMLLNQFVKAADLDTARMLEPRVRLMLKRYEKTAASGQRDPDPQDRLSHHLDRSSNGGGGNGRNKNLSPAQVRELTAQANRLARARRFKEADAIFAQINA